MITFEMGERVAARAARRFRRFGWSPADAHQQAWVAMLEALRRHKPKGDRPLEPWLWTVVVNAFRDQHRRGRIHTVPEDIDPTADVPDRAEDPAAALATQRWVIRWVARVETLLDGRRREVVRAVIVEEERPAQVAERTGMPVRDVYNAVSLVRERKLKRDPVLRSLMEEVTRGAA